LVLLILAVIWAAVLLPPYLQNRSESRPADSISSFQRQLSVLERRSGMINPALQREVREVRAYATPIPAYRLSRADAKKRRRDVFFTLAGAAGVTFFMAVLLGGPVWGLHLLCDLLLAGYVVLLMQIQQRQLERAAKVRYLPNRSVRTEPALLLRRSGS
jgi:hypothetical protein